MKPNTLYDYSGFKELMDGVSEYTSRAVFFYCGNIYKDNVVSARIINIPEVYNGTYKTNLN